MGLLTKIGLAVPVTIGNLITKGISAITGKKYGKTTIKESASTKVGKVLGTSISLVGAAAGIAAVVAAPAVAIAAGKTVAKAAAVQVIKSPIKSIAVAAVVAGGGLKLVEPVFQATKTATEKAVPVLLGEEKITSDTAKDVLKTAGIILGVGALGTVAGVVTEKILSKEEEVAAATAAVIPALGSNTIEKEMPSGSSLEGIPLTPATTTITTGKKKRRKAKAAISPMIRNNVQISILNKPVGMQIRNTRYLKIPVYA